MFAPLTYLPAQDPATDWSPATSTAALIDSEATGDSAKPARRGTWRLLAEEAAYRPVKLAQLCQVSLRHLERRFKAEVGVTPRLWLRQERLRSALALLRTTQSVKEVAYGLGYCQFSQFCREFKIGFGLTPTQFRRLHESEQDRLFEVGTAVTPDRSITGREMSPPVN